MCVCARANTHNRHTHTHTRTHHNLQAFWQPYRLKRLQEVQSQIYFHLISLFSVKSLLLQLDVVCPSWEIWLSFIRKDSWEWRESYPVQRGRRLDHGTTCFWNRFSTSLAIFSTTFNPCFQRYLMPLLPEPFGLSTIYRYGNCLVSPTTNLGFSLLNT